MYFVRNGTDWRWRHCGTGRKLEATDARTPRSAGISRTFCPKILVHIPKSTTICGINRQVGIITPPPNRRDVKSDVLGTCPREQLRFALRHLTEWIVGKSARVGNRWKICRRRRAITYGDVAGGIHADAAHPAIQLIDGCKRALLIDGRR